MTYIGTVQRTPPLFRETFDVCSDATFTLEDIRSLSDAPWRLLCWVTAEAFSQLDAGLTGDVMVRDFACLTDLGAQRLYRIDLSERGADNVPRAAAIAYDIIILELTMTASGERITARFPSREALSAWYDYIKTQGYSFHLERLYSETPAASLGGTPSRFNMTEAQAEALYRAFEAGYFDVPRKTDLATIAAEMGISTSALSKRLRRGQRHLINNTIAQYRDA